MNFSECIEEMKKGRYVRRKINLVLYSKDILMDAGMGEPLYWEDYIANDWEIVE
jgi:hypothetical protein